MKTRKKYGGFLGLLLLTGLSGISGCGPDLDLAGQLEETVNENIVVGFSEVGAESDWRVANTESMRRTFTEEKGYELLFDDAKQKLENQIGAIRNYVLREVDYIVVAPVVEKGWEGVLQEAKDADIPLIVVDRMMDVEDDSLFTAWVGSDFYKEGQMAMTWLEEYLREQGREGEEIQILHVKGTEGASAQLGRTQGLEEGIASHPGWKLLASIPGEFTQAKAYEEVAAVLETGAVPDVVYCENDDSAFGAIQALEKAGISYGTEGEVIIISFDATEAGLTACMEGRINLDVECNPMHGPRVESIIQKLEQGEEPEKWWYVEETYFQPQDLTPELIAARGY